MRGIPIQTALTPADRAQIKEGILFPADRTAELMPGIPGAIRISMGRRTISSMLIQMRIGIRSRSRGPAAD